MRNVLTNEHMGQERRKAARHPLARGVGIVLITVSVVILLFGILILISTAGESKTQGAFAHFGKDVFVCGWLILTLLFVIPGIALVVLPGKGSRLKKYKQ